MGSGGQSLAIDDKIVDFSTYYPLKYCFDLNRIAGCSLLWSAVIRGLKSDVPRFVQRVLPSARPFEMLNCDFDVGNFDVGVGAKFRREDSIAK